MNEPRFIELLNLYVDQQLSQQEAAELEAEIQQSPARRRTYQQYCRMQKACAQLFEHERSAAPASAALSRAMTEADRKIVAFPGQRMRRSIWPVGFSMGAVAAAACVAFVFLRQNDSGGVTSGGEIVATTEKTPVVRANDAVVAVATSDAKPSTAALTISATASPEAFTSVFKVPTLRSSATGMDGLFVSAGAADGQIFDWTQDVQLKPLRRVSIEEFAFDQRTAVDKPVTTQFSTTTADDLSMEMTVIEFTK